MNQLLHLLKQTEANEAVNDNDNVNDTVNVINITT